MEGSLKSIINFKIKSSKVPNKGALDHVTSLAPRRIPPFLWIPFLCYSLGLYWGHLQETCTQIMLFHLSQKWCWACDLSEPCLPHGEDFSQASVSRWVKVLLMPGKDEPNICFFVPLFLHILILFYCTLLLFVYIFLQSISFQGTSTL